MDLLREGRPRKERVCLKIIGALLLLCGVGPVWAAEDGPSEFDFFAQEAQTITASRRLQPVREAPVAVEVITEEEIRASGATNIWDLMRFRVGMEVMDARAGDGNRGVVSVRGFPREYVNNLQVLVDGRSVFSTYGGGVYWPQLPVQLQDIERIEIVRGPNAALYGSNAGLGVINIITKKPAEGTAGSVEGQVGNERTVRSAVSFERATGAGGFRLSYTYRNEDAFVPPTNKAGQDDILSNKVNLRGYWKPADRSMMEFFAGGSWVDNTVPRGNEGHFRDGFGMLKFSHDLSVGSSIELMASRSYAYHAIFPIESTLRFGDVDYYQNELSAVHHFGWLGDRLQTTWGAEYRKVDAGSERVFEGKPDQINRTARGFVHQSIRVLDPLTFVVAASLERSDTGGTQPAYQAVVLMTPSDNHTIRVSYSLAPTLPSLYEKEVNHLPSGFARIIGNPELKPEKLTSYEIGYIGTYLAKRLRLEENLFVMDIDDVSASFTVPNPTPPPPNIVSFGNRNAAVAKGSETKLGYWFSPGRSVYANYTYEYFTDDLNDIMVVKATPRHKVNLGGMADLGHGVNASINAGYKSSYTTIPANRSAAFIRKMPPYWRVDSRLAYSPNPNVELAVAGQNLLAPRHKEFSDFDNLEVARAYYGSVTVRF